MRRTFGLIGLAMILAGCQASEAVAPESSGQATQNIATVGGPISRRLENRDPNEIGLKVRPGPAITVYSSADDAFRIFHDPKVVGFESDDLPPTFQPPLYSARTWEEDTLHMGFGEILYNRELVAAIYEEDKANQQRLNELVNDHQDQVGSLQPRTLTGKHVSYWFWDKDDRRLMICGYFTGHDVVKITVAVGDRRVMDGLDMSVEKATKDEYQIDRSFTIQRPTPAPVASGGN